MAESQPTRPGQQIMSGSLSANSPNTETGTALSAATFCFIVYIFLAPYDGDLVCKVRAVVLREPHQSPGRKYEKDATDADLRKKAVLSLN